MRNFSLIFFTLFFTHSIYAEEIEQKITQDQYKVLMKKAEQEHDSDTQHCNRLKDSANKICQVKADGKKSAAEAYFYAKLNPSLENHVDARIAFAEAKYAVAVEMCADKTNETDCINLANKAKDEEIADARAFTKPNM